MSTRAGTLTARWRREAWLAAAYLGFALVLGLVLAADGAMAGPGVRS